MSLKKVIVTKTIRYILREIAETNELIEKAESDDDHEKAFDLFTECFGIFKDIRFKK